MFSFSRIISIVTLLLILTSCKSDEKTIFKCVCEKEKCTDEELDLAFNLASKDLAAEGKIVDRSWWSDPERFEELSSRIGNYIGPQCIR